MSLWQQVDAAQRRRECTLPGGYEERRGRVSDSSLLLIPPRRLSVPVVVREEERRKRRRRLFEFAFAVLISAQTANRFRANLGGKILNITVVLANSIFMSCLRMCAREPY